MKRKIILMTIFAALSASSLPASAVPYVDSRVSPASSYSIQQLSPVVFNYSGTYGPNVYSNYGPSTYSGMLPSTPSSILNANVSPVTTNYGQNIGISYDLYLGSVYGSANERGNLVTCIKNMPLTKIGIGRTVSDLTSLYTNSSNDMSYWSYDSNSNDNIILRCGNYVVTFKSYKTSYGIDVYAEVSYPDQNYKLTETQISNFFADLSNKLYEKEQKEKAEKEAAEKVQSPVYNNSVIINGNNSGTVNFNSYK